MSRNGNACIAKALLTTIEYRGSSQSVIFYVPVSESLLENSVLACLDACGWQCYDMC